MRKLHSLGLVMALGFALVTMVTACGQDQATGPAPDSTGSEPAVTVQPPNPPPTEAPAPTASGSTASAPTASFAGAPVSPTPGPPVTEKTADELLTVLSSWSSSSPSVRASGSAGSFNLSPFPQTVESGGGLTVSAIGSVTVAADEGYVVVIPEQRYGPSGPEQTTSEDRMDIVEKLSDIGIDEREIEFGDFGRFGPASISVELELDGLEEKATLVVDAVEEVVRHSESSGVRYTLTKENCDLALALARREAIPSAETAANDWAEALDLALGAVTGVLEYPLTVSPYFAFNPDADSCGSSSPDPYANIVPFDSEQEVQVSIAMQITYRIQ